jgi:hypothetical protein
MLLSTLIFVDASRGHCPPPYYHHMKSRLLPIHIPTPAMLVYYYLSLLALLYLLVYVYDKKCYACLPFLPSQSFLNTKTIFVLLVVDMPKVSK